jgi:hypothetical protein
MTSALRARHATLFALGLLALVFIFAGCDSDGLDDRYHDDPDVINDVRVINFSLNDRDNRDDFIFDRQFSDSGLEVQYEGAFSALTERAVDDGIVLLYASDVVDADGLERQGWTALPLTQGVDLDGDFFVDFTLATTYTYDIGRLYVNLVASNDFSEEDFAITDVELQNIEGVLFKLVVLPGGGLARGIDYSDYEAVKQAYNLPD